MYMQALCIYNKYIECYSVVTTYRAFHILPKIYTANHATFTMLVHSRYTRMAGFGRREIEYMQALCIYNKYLECYSVWYLSKLRTIF